VALSAGSGFAETLVMKLYSGPLSLFTAKVRIALAEKGVPYERIEVPFSKKHAYQPHHPEVDRLNPKGQVPVLVDGELALYDSTVITEYLEDRFPNPPLYPRDPAGRARCRQLEAAADEILFPHVWTLIQAVFYAGNESAEVAAARAAIHGHQHELDHGLAGREYLCGAFSVADVGYWLDLLYASSNGCPLDPRFQNLAAWWARVSARPSVSEELAGLMKASAELSTHDT
jgi:glutathione S-transferase